MSGKGRRSIQKKGYSVIQRQMRKAAALFLACTLFLSGCGSSGAAETPSEPENQINVETMGLQPIFDYELPQEKPGVFVNRDGYFPGSTKIAVFQGEELPETFQVLEKESGSVVYQGKISYKGVDAVSGKSVYHGNFTQLQEAGDYYIQCDKIGCSYYFSIREDVYSETAKGLREYLEAAKEQETLQDEKWYLTGGWRTDSEGSRDTIEACETLSYLMAAYELYPEQMAQIWQPESGGEPEAGAKALFEMLRYETDWLLFMQDSKSGGIYGGIKNITGVSEEILKNDKDEYLLRDISEEATACFAGTMAKYSYLYQQYDWEYANTCLKAASKAWKYLERSGSGQNAEKGIERQFYAAAELYRASNERRYHNFILVNQETILAQEEDFYLLMGEITYLCTRRNVDKELCNQMIDSLMDKAKDIAGKNKQGLFLVEKEDQEEIFCDATIMAVVNYAITNHEYFMVIENYVHYFMGRNRDAEILLDSLEIKNDARMLLMFCAVKENIDS